MNHRIIDGIPDFIKNLIVFLMWYMYIYIRKLDWWNPSLKSVKLQDVYNPVKSNPPINQPSITCVSASCEAQIQMPSFAIQAGTKVLNEVQFTAAAL